MRTWVKWGGLALAVGLVASSTSTPDSALAADHRDGGALKATGADVGDINDVYTFMDGDDLVVIGSIGGLPSADFSDAVQYVFHIGRTDSALGALTAYSADETLVVCTFDGLDSTTCVVGPAGGDVAASVSGDATANTGLANEDGNLTIHAGVHKDPFFFFLAGFNTAFDYIDTIAAAVPTIDDEAGCPDLSLAADGPGGLATTSDAGMDNATIGGAIFGMLTGVYDAAGDYLDGDAEPEPTDQFATNDISALVVRLSPDLLAGSGDFYQVWMSTHTAP
jgi:hypothetical protein